MLLVACCLLLLTYWLPVVQIIIYGLSKNTFVDAMHQLIFYQTSLLLLIAVVTVNVVVAVIVVTSIIDPQSG